jgi:hypothetical protein
MAALCYHQSCSSWLSDYSSPLFSFSFLLFHHLLQLSLGGNYYSSTKLNYVKEIMMIRFENVFSLQSLTSFYFNVDEKVSLCLF